MATYSDLCQRSDFLGQTLISEDDYAYQTFSGEGPLIHFCHANGYSPLVYSELIQNLSDSYSIQAPLMRPLWQPFNNNAIHDWWPFVNDLNVYFNSQTQSPSLAIGHSIGATLLLILALQQPHRFKKLVLIDPAIFPRPIYWIYKMLKYVSLHRACHPLINKTLKRKRFFNSEEELFSRFREKPIFSLLSDRAVINYIQGTFIYSKDGYELLFPPEWEALIYESGIVIDSWIWKHLKSLNVPVLLIRGEHSNLCTVDVEKRFLDTSNCIQSITLEDSGHLVALEQAKCVSDAIQLFYD